MTEDLPQSHRPLTRIRTDVVVLLVERATRALAAVELALAATATRAELRAAADITARLLDEEREHIAGLTRIRELTAPYFATLPAGATFGDVMPLMTDIERTELAAITRDLPTDGDVIVPRTA
ncbi:hypothetical protein [Streptomyces canus]|uniref:hypothetical protein n=1 Tax=Streptomyces canus TaxID=58343 RepID=UPI0003646CA1|nr:hypothetical protein [Streptomyces canus]